MDTRIIEGPYLADLLEQPVALRRTWEGLSPADELLGAMGGRTTASLRRIVLTGMGASYHALYPLHLRLSQLGLPSLLWETSELIPVAENLLDTDTLLIAVSQSGRSAETVRLLDRPRCRPLTIGVTNNGGSPLAAKSHVVLPLHAGNECSVSCKTYVASLLVLDWLGAILCGDDLAATRERLQRAEAAAREYLLHWREHVHQLLQFLSGVDHIFITGRGSSLASAGTGGLILKEAARFPVEGMTSAAFRHGPFEMLTDRVLVLVFAGDNHCLELNRRLVDDIQTSGGRSAIVGPEAATEIFRLPPVSASIRPIVEILPVQMLSLALAARAGREAGKFERASKVTTVE